MLGHDRKERGLLATGESSHRDRRWPLQLAPAENRHPDQDHHQAKGWAVDRGSMSLLRQAVPACLQLLSAGRSPRPSAPPPKRTPTPLRWGRTGLRRSHLRATRRAQHRLYRIPCLILPPWWSAPQVDSPPLTQEQVLISSTPAMRAMLRSVPEVLSTYQPSRMSWLLRVGLSQVVG